MVKNRKVCLFAEDVSGESTGKVQTMDKITIQDLDLKGHGFLCASILMFRSKTLKSPMICAFGKRSRRSGTASKKEPFWFWLLIWAARKGNPNRNFHSLPVAERLSELLGKKVTFVPECIGPEVEKAVNAAKPGDVILLENLRFHPEEEANDPEFSKKLAAYTPIYVNDAFGSAHRAHASTEGITHYVRKAAAGFLMEKELRYLGGALESPQRPFIAILGGAKISDKIEVIENLLGKVDRLLIGGAMVFTFLKSQGKSIGKSLCEDDKLDLARELLARAQSRIVLPIDAVASSGLDDEASAHIVPSGQIPEGEMGLDIGPKAIGRVCRNYSLRKNHCVEWPDGRV